MSFLVVIARNTVGRSDFDVQKLGYLVHNHREIEKSIHARDLLQFTIKGQHVETDDEGRFALPAWFFGWLFSAVRGKKPRNETRSSPKVPHEQRRAPLLAQTAKPLGKDGLRAGSHKGIAQNSR